MLIGDLGDLSKFFLKISQEYLVSMIKSYTFALAKQKQVLVRTINQGCFQWVISSAGSEHLPYKQRVGGSNPSSPTQHKDGSLAQLNRAFDYGSKGCRFESCRSHKALSGHFIRSVHFFVMLSFKDFFCSTPELQHEHCKLTFFLKYLCHSEIMNALFN